MVKRAYGTAFNPIVINGGGKRTTMVRRRLSARRGVVAGVTRVGGFYGRYSGRSAELKFHDVDLDDAAISIAGTITPSVNLIAQGVTESTRVGRKCVIRSFNWHYTVSLGEKQDDATPPDSDTIRVILYLDKQCNGATATTTGILESDDFQSFRNLANSGRFVILMDRSHDVDRKTLTSTQNADTFDAASVRVGRSFYKKCNIPLEFDSTTGAITEIRSNNIGVLLLSVKNGASFESKIRIRFSDGS